MRKTVKVAGFIGTADTAVVKTLGAERPDRLYLVVHCNVTGGVPMRVSWGTDAHINGSIDLQPGETVVFSKTGDMPWAGRVSVLGIGGTATYRGADVYEE